MIFGTPFQVVGAMAYIDKKKGGGTKVAKTLWSSGEEDGVWVDRS